MYITHIVVWELNCKLPSIYPENIRQMTLHWAPGKRLAVESTDSLLRIQVRQRCIKSGPPSRPRVTTDSFIRRAICVLATSKLTASEALEEMEQRRAPSQLVRDRI